MKKKHTIEVIDYLIGSYSQGDSVSYEADGKYITVTGEFAVDKNGIRHHIHEFEDGTEMEVTFG